MKKIALVTCLESTDPLFIALQNELSRRFNPENTMHEIFHGKQTCADIAEILKSTEPNIQIEVGFDFSCNVPRIGLTMKTLRENKDLFKHKIRYYYRKKKVGEHLTPSLQKLLCFKTLMEKSTELAVA